MRISKRTLITMLALTTGALSMALATGAFAAPGKTHPTHPSHPSHPGHPSHHGRHTGAPLIDESVAPSQPGDPTFHGVSPGMAPWVLKSGNVRLKRDGKLDLHVTGLVIPTTGTPTPVTSITASLYCGADSNTAAAATSQPAPLSPKGDARIHDGSFGAPSSCLAPVILVHPNGLSNLYIALSGWR